MARHTQWFGTQEESVALLNALAHHCTCERDEQGATVQPCAPHRMLVHEQRALDGLLFARHLVDRLLREEWLVGGVVSTPARLQVPVQ